MTEVNRNVHDDEVRMSLEKIWMSKTMKTMPGNQMSSKTGTRLLIDKLELSKSYPL